MTVRALVVAIESYPQLQVGGIAPSLPGTLAAGLAFRDWLRGKWRAEGRDPDDPQAVQLLFCSEPVQPFGRGATADDIRGALLDLKQAGQGATEELYVFFSGHGFAFVARPGSRADVLIASDFKSPALSGHACLNLDEMIVWLRDHLGVGRHYYFVDACRNALDARQIQVGPLLPFDPQANGEASTFVLQSVPAGAVAPVGGPFAAALLDGLNGRGRAKAWSPNVPDAMFVRFDSLRSYLKARLAGQQTVIGKAEGPDDQSEAVLATLRPIPQVTCTIEVAGAPPALAGAVVYRRGRSSAEQRTPLAHQPLPLRFEPDDYAIAVELPGAVATTAATMPLDLYEDRTLVFTRVPTPAPVAAEPMAGAAAEADLDIVVPDGARLELRNIHTGAEETVARTARVRLPRGRYLSVLRNADGSIARRRELEIAAGEQARVDTAAWRDSTPHVAIARHLPPHAVRGDAVDFSEALGGPVTDPDLDLWLAIVGGGRVLGARGDYSKLAGLPLRDFRDARPGVSPIYVLGGFEDAGAVLRVGVSRGAEPTWQDAVQPPDMPGIREALAPVRPGWRLLSLRFGEEPPYTIASFAMPNRATLVTVTRDDEGRFRLAQYLLPIGHLVGHLPEEVRQRLDWRNHLRDVRFLAQASRAFRKRRDLLREAPGPDLLDLLYAKWLDPIASSLAAYEMIRRGRRGDMGEVVDNMRRFFAELPDTFALARLAGLDLGRPEGPPLFFDGLRAFPDHADWLPLPAANLDFASPWTAWRAAVWAG